MERKHIKARPKMDSMGIADGQMETESQSKSDYMVRFLLILFKGISFIEPYGISVCLCSSIQCNFPP